MLLKIFLRFFKFIFREGGREGERKEGNIRNIDVQEKHGLVAPCTPPTWDLAHKPGMCLTRKGIGDLLPWRAMPNPLSYAAQGSDMYDPQFS